MDSVGIEDIKVTKLQKILVAGGDVSHAMKNNSVGFVGFGEAYFSFILPGAVKAWKRHLRMTLNLIVPKGNVGFVFIDGNNSVRVLRVGENNYSRLTIPPGIWFGFKGLSSEESLILNIADIKHDEGEVDRMKIEDINFDWSSLS